MSKESEQGLLPEGVRLGLIFKKTYELAFDLAIRLGISDVKEAQEQAWTKVGQCADSIIKESRQQKEPLEEEKMEGDNVIRLKRRENCPMCGNKFEPDVGVEELAVLREKAWRYDELCK